MRKHYFCIFGTGVVKKCKMMYGSVLNKLQLVDDGTPWSSALFVEFPCSALAQTRDSYTLERFLIEFFFSVYYDPIGVQKL